MTNRLAAFVVVGAVAVLGAAYLLDQDKKARAAERAKVSVPPYAVAKIVDGTSKGAQVAAKKASKNNDLASESLTQVASSKQIPLDLGIEVQKDINGVEMGVLENGMPFLTQRSLSEVAGGGRVTLHRVI